MKIGIGLDIRKKNKNTNTEFSPDQINSLEHWWDADNNLT